MNIKKSMTGEEDFSGKNSWHFENVNLVFVSTEINE